jgi:hypothetical protein
MATQFHTPGADGEDMVIPVGEPFTTWRLVEDGETLDMVVNHPWNALDV